MVVHGATAAMDAWVPGNGVLGERGGGGNDEGLQGMVGR
jgi:hypothetical protein